MNIRRFTLLAAIMVSLFVLQGCYSPARADGSYPSYLYRHDNSYFGDWRYQDRNFRHFDRRKHYGSNNQRPGWWRNLDDNPPRFNRRRHHDNNDDFFHYRRRR